MANKVNGNCFIHSRTCCYFCAYSKCEVKIICQKCVNDHVKIHPRHFIYEVENLSEVHAFDKLGRLKQILGRQKLSNEQKIKKIYEIFDALLNPLINKVRQFESASKDLILKQFLQFLAQNKILIESCKINKSDPTKTRVQPEIMIEQVIAEVGLIQQRQNQIKKNIEKFTLYVDSTAQMSKTVQKQVNESIEKVKTFLDNCKQLQQSKYQVDQSGDLTPFKQFFLDYLNNHRAASKIENNKIELTLVEYKKQIQMKDQELKFAKQENRNLLSRIDQLNKIIAQLRDQILDYKGRQEREERQRKQAISIARQKMEQFLIRSQVVLNQSRTISLQKKTLQIKYIDVLLDMVKNPVQLILSQHNLSKEQLHRFMYENEQKKISYKVIKILRMSFMQVDEQFLQKALKYFQNLHTLQLNSCNLNDQTLETISQQFPKKLKHLHLIDNKLNDQGIEKMLAISQKKSITFQSLYLSYNNLKPNAIDSINRYCWDLRILHISKNLIGSKGVSSIAKGLKNLEELFIGGTTVGKEGILSLCRCSFKLKRLSLVATQITTDIVSEIMLALPKLEWLDISYSTLPQGDVSKIQKIKAFNKNLQIVLQF